MARRTALSPAVVPCSVQWCAALAPADGPLDARCVIHAHPDWRELRPVLLEPGEIFTDTRHDCEPCGGSGECAECDGQGEVEHTCSCGHAGCSHDCADCKGGGKCPHCGGAGYGFVTKVDEAAA